MVELQKVRHCPRRLQSHRHRCTSRKSISSGVPPETILKDRHQLGRQQTALQAAKPGSGHSQSSSRNEYKCRNSTLSGLGWIISFVSKPARRWLSARLALNISVPFVHRSKHAHASELFCTSNHHPPCPVASSRHLGKISVTPL